MLDPLELELKGGCEAIGIRAWEPNSGLLQEQQALLTPEQSSALHSICG